MASIKFNTKRILQQNEQQKKWLDIYQLGECFCSCGEIFETSGTVLTTKENYIFIRTKHKCPNCGSDNMALEFKWFPLSITKEKLKD